MRAAVFAIASLIVGVVVGGLVGRQEFADEILPSEEILRPRSGSPETEDHGPRLTILSPDRFDFGAMDRNATMKHTFEIQNDGNEPLTVTQQGTSCKCTKAGVNKDRLLPGEKAQITIEWEAKNAVEPYEQYADYETNDPRRRKFRVLVHGHILETLRADPMEVAFNRVSAIEPARATIRIYGARDGGLTIVSHKFTEPTSAPFYSLQFRPLTAAEVAAYPGFKSGLEMTVDLKAGLPLGQMDQSIQITTNLNPDATFDIPVYGSVVSDISLAGQNTTPERMVVALGSITSAKGAKSTIYLVVKGPHRDQTELKIAEVLPNAELTVTLGEPIRDNPQIVSYPVTLVVPPKTMPISRMGVGSVTVRVETTHPQLKELTFYVRYAVVE